ncbi:nucleotide exchange factor GrpE [Namhaeicola litoreus]|uniref:Protein GrpE n=1 Tax=Namhaeicola litoreus TaxID=1052145 RepID=A0ABW3Y491_9FLAO
MTKQNKSNPAQNDAEFEDQINELDQSEIEDQAEDNKEESEPNLDEELQKERNNFLRLFAEFENYKKRTSKERIELYSTANRELMTALLPILDDFERGLKELEKSDDDALFQGMQLIYNKFKNTLTTKGLKEVEVKMGDVFDAEIHEAISQVPAPSDDLKGKIYDVVEKGYKLGDTIVRFPKVVTCL